MTEHVPDTLLSIEGLSKEFGVRGAVRLGRMGSRGRSARLRAVDHLDFSVRRGEVVGLVGESGCGKTTVARTLMRLIEPTSGEIWFDGLSLVGLRGRRLKAFRRDAQIVFQDPFASLDGRFTVLKTLAEPLIVHKVCPRSEIPARAAELLGQVGLHEGFLGRYRHELSGGEAQRVSIARALATGPRFLVLDEPTSALDASARLQTVHLLQELKESLGMTYLVISHDLSIIRHLCDRVLVMYLGGIVEEASASVLFDRPQHPYTEALLSATAVPNPVERRPRIRLRKNALRQVDGVGCPLAPRCHRAAPECASTPQRLVEVASGHRIACDRVSEGQITLPSSVPLVQTVTLISEEGAA